MHKYWLSAHCRYVKGACSSAIYDLYHGQVYSLNQDATVLLDQILAEGSIHDDDAVSFLNDLCKKQLLNCSSLPAEECKENPPLALRYVWLELTNRCNCRCLHCYGAFGMPDRETIALELTVDEWKRIIDRIRDFGGNAVQLIGGEPMLHPCFCELLSYAREKGFETIDVFTNGTMMTDETIKSIQSAGASVRVSLYGYDAASHERITQLKGSFSRLDKSLDMLRESGIPTKIAVVLMEENQEHLDRIISYITDKGHQYTGFDIVRRACHNTQFCHAVTDPEIIRQRTMTEARFFTSDDSFRINSRWNSCWYGKLAITASGDILPCIFARNMVCGNLRKDPFDRIKAKLLKYWNITKDHVSVCCDCEYRYACDDCRPLAEGKTGNLLAKYPRCLYDPYNGKWLQS